MVFFDPRQEFTYTPFIKIDANEIPFQFLKPVKVNIVHEFWLPYLFTTSHLPISPDSIILNVSVQLQISFHITKAPLTVLTHPYRLLHKNSPLQSHRFPAVWFETEKLSPLSIWESKWHQNNFIQSMVCACPCPLQLTRCCACSLLCLPSICIKQQPCLLTFP